MIFNDEKFLEKIFLFTPRSRYIMCVKCNHAGKECLKFVSIKKFR